MATTFPEELQGKVYSFRGKNSQMGTVVATQSVFCLFVYHLLLLDFEKNLE